MTASQAASSPATPSTKPAQAKTADRTGGERENRVGVILGVGLGVVLILSTSLLFIVIVRQHNGHWPPTLNIIDEFLLLILLPLFICMVAAFPALMVLHYRNYGFRRVQRQLDDTLNRIYGRARNVFDHERNGARFWLPIVINFLLLVFLFGIVMAPEAAEGLGQQLIGNRFVYYPAIEAGDTGVVGYPIIDVGAYVDYIVEHASMITWCFLGAYFYILTVLVRRWMRSDLSPGLIWKLNVRLMIAFILGFVMELLWGQGEVGAADPLLVTTSQTALAAVAFFVGIVPSDLFRWLQVKLGALIGKVANVAVSDELEKQIDGINFWQMDRLNEEGIESVEDLAMVDIPRLLAGTRFDAPHVMYWIDQALLVHSVGDDLDKFKLAYVRTATDFLDCYTPTEGAALPVDGLPAGHLNNLRTALENSPNIIYVRNYWDSFKQERVPPPEPDPSPSI